MGLWRMASGVFTEPYSILQSTLSRCTASFRTSDIEKAVIHATSHTDPSLDRPSIQRICEWLRLSPCNLAPLLRAVSWRMSKTRNWVVALKGLYLMHSVIDSRLPCVEEIGRLPFDLSDFKDGYISKARSWPFNEFIRAYYAFLDQKSAVVFMQMGEKPDADDTMPASSLIAQELALLQKMQVLIDLLLQMKPQSGATYFPIVLEVMDWIIIEIYDLYSRMCRGIALVLLNIHYGGKADAILALDVVQKATQQGEDLAEYLHYCRKLGISSSSGFLTVDPIPPEFIYELEKVINSFSNDGSTADDRWNNNNEMETIITEEWEKFDDEEMVQSSDEMPDLISFQ